MLVDTEEVVEELETKKSFGCLVLETVIRRIMLYLCPYCAYSTSAMSSNPRAVTPTSTQGNNITMDTILLLVTMQVCRLLCAFTPAIVPLDTVVLPSC